MSVAPGRHLWVRDEGPGEVDSGEDGGRHARGEELLVEPWLEVLELHAPQHAHHAAPLLLRPEGEVVEERHARHEGLLGHVEDAEVRGHEEAPARGLEHLGQVRLSLPVQGSFFVENLAFSAKAVFFGCNKVE
jgi:hypothetical protein